MKLSKFEVVILIILCVSIGCIPSVFAEGETIRIGIGSMSCPKGGYASCSDNEAQINCGSFNMIIRQEYTGLNCSADEFRADYLESFITGCRDTLGAPISTDSAVTRSFGSYTFVGISFTLNGKTYTQYLLPINEWIFIFTADTYSSDSVLNDVLSTFSLN